MATESVGGNATSGPVSSKLQDRMNTLREVIDRNKSEVLKVSGELKQLIEDKTQQIIGELEGVWDRVNLRMRKKREEVNKKIEEINKRKIEMEELFKELNPTSTPTIEISEAISSVRREFDIDIPYDRITWRVSDLIESIQIHKPYACEQLNENYKQDSDIRVKWGTCSRGKGDNELLIPYGVAIDSINNRVFVADRGTNSIQVFSGSGDWVKSLEDGQMKLPENINIIHNSLFVQCYKTIVKFDRTSLARESHKSYYYPLSGICTDNTSVYVGAYNGMMLIALTQELNEKRQIPLTTQYTQEDTEINDISIAPTREEFYVLLSYSEYPIQSFSKRGTLTRCIVHKDILINALCFCLDEQLNILVADRGSSRVKIFSNDGKLLTQFGKKGKEIGEFFDLTGIAVDDSYDIITTDLKDHCRLQTFSQV